ncbi:aldo/keto reductase [Histidinibacterium aquaticum]|uniref:Aldo/keto reductase n=1 Tax=Histidinibacterium aquaticum TaxID=2613962 RepID=A0A5J5GRV6_9RHOB|nr:aldo/keto reductase [Histidinibacterium aquaticum]KAA9010318.1 aldo/keto reductase [Histidinibacterium aquaticum]
MKRIELGRSGIEVPDWCLGTMTYGNQTPEDDAHRQIDMALDAGIDFMDCAEMYPVAPVTKETVGRSEEILGNWFAKSGKRDRWTVATKVSGPNGGFVRDGKGYDGTVIPQAVDASLKRLQTDVIDVYQLHWPDRGSYHFRKYWAYDPSKLDAEAVEAHMLDVLRAMDEMVKAGKVRAFALSNETAWGTAQWCRLADREGLPRPASIQNEYSLLCRVFDTDLAETCTAEDVTLLSFSPLGAGLLTGKYQGGQIPEDSRRARQEDLGGRITERVWDAVAAYHAVAQRHGLDPVQMALAWQRSRPFPISAIFGARSVEQLERILGGIDLELSDEVVADIDATHKAHPMPF